MSNKKSYIELKNVRVNNLKNISLKIPRGKFIVVTGVSGSGKSSLAFDTLYAEGQRRYVESLSSYARQFMGKMKKPECDYIIGLPPAIAIEQKTISRNPRSTVGTSTEIYEYLKLLFARIGKTYSPVSGTEVKKHSVADIISHISQHNMGERFMIEAPIVVPEDRTFEEQVEALRMQGYTHFDDHYLVVDRLSVNNTDNWLSRVTDSCETAYYEGHGECRIKFVADNQVTDFSMRYEADGITFEEPNENMFSFNSPLGACPECEGFGNVIGIDEHAVIPDTSLSIYENAVTCWRGEKMSQWQNEFIHRAAEIDFPIFAPYYTLTQEQKDYLWHGPAGTSCKANGDSSLWFPSIDRFFEFVKENQYKIQYRVMLARFRGKTICPSCHGTRLKSEVQYVKVDKRNITELSSMQLTDLKEWIDKLPTEFLTETEIQISKRLITEISHRLQFLLDVGLGYLTLNRASNTLSGGESQRINLTTSLGSSLVGSLYILDEPSIGLHSRDTERLIKVIRELTAIGNTVVVVEHDEEIIRAADHIIDIGPNAGVHGGEVVFQGSLTPCFHSSLLPPSSSLTLAYLTGEQTIPVPQSRRAWNSFIQIKGARMNNLKNIDVQIPLNVMTVVTGVSGSGKSSLIRGILYPVLKRRMDETADVPGEHTSISGNISAIKQIEFVDQNPIGKSSRSNPATYVKAYDAIRDLYANQQLAKQIGMKSQFFSFNTEGGRCEECKGTGIVTVEMQFMADIVLECSECHGNRFKKDVLDVCYHGKNINDVLNMSIDEAITFFDDSHGQPQSNEDQRLCKTIIKRLRPLSDVGLGYIKLGQSSSSLSGGESQRVKLAFYIGQEKQDPTLFIFDEPTTGLHLHDISKLLNSMNSLIDRGHTILIIEHNMEIIKNADYIIDLGPEGGNEGGYLIATGTPEDITHDPASTTGKFIKQKI